MDRASAGGLDRARLVHRLADDVHDAPERLLADRNADRLPRIAHTLPAYEPFARVHGDRAHGVLAEMLRDLEHQPGAVIVGLQRIQDRRQRAFELHVHHGAGDLRDLAGQIAYVLHHPSSLSAAAGLDGLGARDDFDQFLGDLRLALAVIGQRQVVDHVAGVARRIVHGAHLRAVERRGVLEQRLEDLDRDVARQQLGEDLLLVRLVFVDRAAEVDAPAPSAPRPE